MTMQVLDKLATRLGRGEGMADRNRECRVARALVLFDLIWNHCKRGDACAPSARRMTPLGDDRGSELIAI